MTDSEPPQAPTPPEGFEQPEYPPAPPPQNAPPAQDYPTSGYPPPPPTYPPPTGYQQQGYQQPGYPQPGSQPRPQLSPEEELRRKKARRTILIVVLSVIALILILVVVAGVQACKGIMGHSVKVREWGWRDGSGPAMGSGTTYVLPGTKEPWDTAPADPAKDEQSKANLRAIWAGLQAYEAARGSLPLEIGPDIAMGAYVKPWPTDAWSGLPMTEGSHRGSFSYSSNVSTADLTVYLSP